jgi:hypothetical protein
VAGEEIPRVSSYKYLGVEVTEGFDLGVAAAARAEATRRTLEAARQLLASPQVSIGDKALVVSAIIGATASYCCSLFVGNKSLLDMVQRPLSDAALLAVGSPAGRQLTSAQAALRLLGVPPVHAVALRQAVKLLRHPTFEVLSGLRGDVGWKRDALARANSLRSPSGALLDARAAQDRCWALWEEGRWGELTRARSSPAPALPKSLLVWREAGASSKNRKLLLQLSRVSSSLAPGFLALAQLLVNGRLTFARLAKATRSPRACSFCGRADDLDPLHELLRCEGLAEVRSRTALAVVDRLKSGTGQGSLKSLLKDSSPTNIIRLAAFFFQVHQLRLKTSPAPG